MKGYMYDGKTKEFIGEYDLQLDILESAACKKKVYMLPPNCTKTKPLYSDDSKKNIFLDGEWVLVDDFRNKYSYNKLTKEEVVVERLGELGEDYTMKRPPVLKKYYIFDDNINEWVFNIDLLSDYKENKIGEINKYYYDLIITKYPLHKQINIDRAADGYNEQDKIDKNCFIDGIRSVVRSKEENILNALSKEEVDSFLVLD